MLRILTASRVGGICHDRDCLRFADRLLGGSGPAASSTAGTAAGTPQAIAQVDHSYATSVPVATIQVAVSMIVTAVLTLILKAWAGNRVMGSTLTIHLRPSHQRTKDR